MPAPALPKPWPASSTELAKPIIGKPRELTVTAGEPRTVTMEADR